MSDIELIIFIFFGVCALVVISISLIEGSKVELHLNRALDKLKGMICG